MAKSKKFLNFLLLATSKILNLINIKLFLEIIDIEIEFPNLLAK